MLFCEYEFTPTLLSYAANGYILTVEKLDKRPKNRLENCYALPQFTQLVFYSQVQKQLYGIARYTQSQASTPE